MPSDATSTTHAQTPESNEYDFVIVGSGFGGSVAALRLAQKGYRVAVLEAGKRWQREDFPRSSWNTRKTFWMPGIGLYGMQQVQLFRDAMILSGAGYGGGSLIYGNTLFVPMDSFFQSPQVQQLGGREGLMPFYELAQNMMGVTANRFLTEPDRILQKTAASYGRGDTFTPSPVGIFFGEEGQPQADPYFLGQGPERVGCTACGGCFLGCRFGAKNTLDQNYLYLAEQLGVTMVTETKVTRICPQGDDGSDGYILHTRSSTSRFRPGHRTFRARKLVIAAGVTGTLKLLWSARQRGDLPRLSAQLGLDVRTNSEAIVGVKARRADVDYSRGIAASSSVFPDEHTQIQADRYPKGSDSMAILTTLMADKSDRWPRLLTLLWEIIRHPIRFLRAISPFRHAQRTALLIVMQDIDSSLEIKPERKWWKAFGWALDSKPGRAGKAPTYIPMANDFARKMAAEMDAIPLSANPEVVLGRSVTAHILGGCIIGASPEEGVIDPQHRVHGYNGMWICDGSVIPENLGANPALSILALSERAMSLIPPKNNDPTNIKHLHVDEAWGVTDLLHPSQSNAEE